MGIRCHGYVDFLPKISKHIQFQSVRIEIKSDDKVNVSVYLPLNSGMFFNKDTIKSTIVKKWRGLSTIHNNMAYAQSENLYTEDDIVRLSFYVSFISR